MPFIAAVLTVPHQLVMNRITSPGHNCHWQPLGFRILGKTGGQSAAGPRVTRRPSFGPNDSHMGTARGRPVLPAAECAGGGLGVYYKGSIPCVWGSAPRHTVPSSARRRVKRMQTPQPPPICTRSGLRTTSGWTRVSRACDRGPPPHCSLLSRVWRGSAGPRPRPQGGPRGR